MVLVARGSVSCDSVAKDSVSCDSVGRDSVSSDLVLGIQTVCIRLLGMATDSVCWYLVSRDPVT